MSTPQPQRPAIVKLPPRTPCPVCAGGGHVVVTPRGEAHPAHSVHYISTHDFILAAETMRSSNLRPEEARLRAGLAAIGIRIIPPAGSTAPPVGPGDDPCLTGCKPAEGDVCGGSRCTP